MQQHHHLPPGAGAGAVLPYLAPRRALLVSADAETLSSQDAILRKQGCNDVTALTDPAAAMAELRGGHRFDVVLVHMCPPHHAPAFELLECAIGEMHVAAYAISNKRVIYGPLELKDLNNIRKHIYKEASSGTKSPEAKPNGPDNSSPMATTPTAATLLTPGRRETRRRIRRTRVSDTISQELELDGGNVKNEQEKPPEKSNKARLVWTEELHRKFVEAHDKLPPGDAVPKKILDLMDDSTLTRENIASHLQKHRMNLDPLRSGNPKTKHQKLTPPQASLSSPNMSEQQVSPTMMQPLPTSNFSETQGVVYMNHNMSAQTTNRPPTISGMQDDHPVMHMQSFNGSIYVQTESVFSDVASEEMYSRDNKSKENSTWCPDLSYDRGLQENTDDIVNKDPGGSWEDTYL